MLPSQRSGNKLIILIFYVDHIVMIGRDKEQTAHLKDYFGKELKIKNLGFKILYPFKN